MARHFNREHLDQLRKSGGAKEAVLSALAESVEELGESTERLERAIVGDEAAGHTGLVKRSQEHHKRIARIERIVIYGSGVLATLGLAWEAFKHRFTGGGH